MRKNQDVDSILVGTTFVKAKFGERIKALLDYKAKSSDVLSTLSTFKSKDASRSLAKANFNKSFFEKWIKNNQDMNYADVLKYIYKGYLVNCLIEATKIELKDKEFFNKEILPDLKIVVNKIDHEAYKKLGLDDENFELNDKNAKQISDWICKLLKKEENSNKLSKAMQDASIGSYEKIQSVIAEDVFTLKKANHKLNKKKATYHELITGFLSAVVDDVNENILSTQKTHIEKFGINIAASRQTDKVQLCYRFDCTDDKSLKEFTDQLDQSGAIYAVKDKSVTQYQSFESADEAKRYVEGNRDAFSAYDQVEVLDKSNKVVMNHNDLMSNRYSPR